jgi:hypothetical protein
MAPVLGENGVPLRRGPADDTESLAIADGVAFIGIERVHEVRRFAWAESGLAARGVPIPVPPDTLPGNRGLEAIGVAPAEHPSQDRSQAGSTSFGRTATTLRI